MVYAAAVVTWVVATGTAVSTILVTLSLLLVVGPLFGAFDPGPDNPLWFVAGAVLIVVALSAVANVVAAFMLRGHRWAQWVLLGLCVVTALAGIALGYYIAPLVVSAAAVGVAVLLLLPSARAWFRATKVTSQGTPRSSE